MEHAAPTSVHSGTSPGVPKLEIRAQSAACDRCEGPELSKESGPSNIHACIGSGPDPCEGVGFDVVSWTAQGLLGLREKRKVIKGLHSIPWVTLRRYRVRLLFLKDSRLPFGVMPST